MNTLFEQHLHRHSIKITPPRRQVFEILRDSGPITTRELIARAGQAIDRASVYRTIQLFERLGILHHLILGGHKVIELTDSFSHHHHHLACTHCGKLQSIHDEQLEAALQRVVKTHSFNAQSHLIEVSGHCKECAIKAK